MNDPAQRLWVLERRGEGSRACRDVCRFLGAVAVLRDRAVYVAFIRSPELSRASEVALRANLVRFDLNRDAARFGTLDEAMAWADMMKSRWLARGWSPVAVPLVGQCPGRTGR